MSIPSITDAYLNHINQTLKTVTELNDAIDKEEKKGHYHIRILKNGTLAVEFGSGKKSSFAAITDLMREIKSALNVNSETRNEILASFEKITQRFESKEQSFFAKIFFGKDKEAQVLAAKKLAPPPRATAPSTDENTIVSITLERLVAMNEANDAFNEQVKNYAAKHYYLKVGANANNLPFTLVSPRDKASTFAQITEYLEKKFVDKKQLSSAIIKEYKTMVKKLEDHVTDLKEKPFMNFFRIRIAQHQLQKAEKLLVRMQTQITPEYTINMFKADVERFKASPKIKDRLFEIMTKNLRNNFLQMKNCGKNFPETEGADIKRNYQQIYEEMAAYVNELVIQAQEKSPKLLPVLKEYFDDLFEEANKLRQLLGIRTPSENTSQVSTEGMHARVEAVTTNAADIQAPTGATHPTAPEEEGESAVGESLSGAVAQIVVEEDQTDVEGEGESTVDQVPLEAPDQIIVEGAGAEEEMDEIESWLAEIKRTTKQKVDEEEQQEAKRLNTAFREFYKHNMGAYPSGEDL